MVDVITLVLSVSVACVCVAVACRWLMSREKVVPVGGVDHAGPAQPAHAPTQLVDPDILSVLSQRLALMEGRLPAMQQILDGYAALTVRMGELEANLPHLADAYSKFSQMVLNQEKRANEKQRRSDNRAITVEEAAAEAGMAAGGVPTNRLVDQPADRPERRAGVLGGNGQRSAPK